MDVKTVLVTGGAGFVGARLAVGLREWRSGLRVIALDNLRRRGSELNLARLRAAGVAFVHGDIRCAEDLDAAGPAELILECSAEPSVLAGYGDSPGYVVNTNLTGTVNALEHARRHKAGIIFLSTSRVYPFDAMRAMRYLEKETRLEAAADQDIAGVSEHGISEEFPIAGIRSLYGATKLCSELLIAEYCDMYSLPGVINRCGVITGPGQMGKVDQGVVVLWMARHIYGGALRYIGYGGAGKQVRDMLHVDDLLRLVIHQIKHLDACRGHCYNVGGGRKCSASLLELTLLCQEVTGRRIPITSDPEDRPADIPWYITDHRRVTAATGWQPEHGVRAMLEDIHGWITGNRAALEPILGG